MAESMAKWESLAMSCCRVRRATAPRLVAGLAWWWNPLYRGTDLRHRTIRKREYVVDDRTDETSGRDEKDVGVHSCNCGVAEKNAARWLTCIAVRTHAKTGTLFCMEWRAAMLRCWRMVLSASGIVQTDRVKAVLFYP